MKSFSENYSLNNKTLNKRYEKTLSFMSRHMSPPKTILDLGIDNPFAKIMRQNGFTVDNTKMNQDLDLDFDIVKDPSYNVVTAFEIFEHLVAPLNLLMVIAAPVLIASVPLKLWFANAYWNDDDPWDRHYHEFEPKQFDMLLDKAGWDIVHSEKWKSPTFKLGLRPLLRRITDRYYIVYCMRKSDSPTSF